jgi:hypothetical protein
MDVQQWQRLLLSELYDLGMERTAKQLEKEAGIQLRSDAMVRFHHAVNSAEWNEAINIFKNVKVPPYFFIYFHQVSCYDLFDIGEI